MSSELTTPRGGRAAGRKMVAASLMGAHTHEASNGRSVHVWRRGETYLARGRWDGAAFGETLGRDAREAAARLRRLIGEVEDGAYVRPSDRPRQLVSGRRCPRLTLRQLAAAFLAAKRAERGSQTAGDYRARLRPALDFAERPANLARWPTAADATAEFAAELKSFLMTHETSRNGRSGAPRRLLSAGQVRNALETLRGVYNWASDPAVAKLPPSLPNPLGGRAVPAKPGKNPLRADPLPPGLRERVAARMDAWQLCHLAWSLVLPLRPDEAAGLLIGDANAERGWLEFGRRFGDCNFTKEKTSFVLPYPPEFAPLLAACRGGRAAGPLLRGRRAFGGAAAPESGGEDDLRRCYERAVLAAGPDGVRAEHDRKLAFRRVLKRGWGGISEDRMAAEFKGLVFAETGRRDVRFYDLRHAATQGMKDAGLPHLELRYLTGHSCRDILNEYTSLRPAEAMARYFDSIRPLIDAVSARAAALGLR